MPALQAITDFPNAVSLVTCYLSPVLTGSFVSTRSHQVTTHLTGHFQDQVIADK